MHAVWDKRPTSVFGGRACGTPMAGPIPSVLAFQASPAPRPPTVTAWFLPQSAAAQDERTIARICFYAHERG